MRGNLFLALEGLDGAGTTTQATRLGTWLSAAGREVLMTREPSDGPVGKLIREYLRGLHGGGDPAALALLFAADRRDHLAREIEPALLAGRDVVSDRYLMSSLAYQGRNGNLAWVQTINERAREPDLTVLIDVPVEECLRRIGSRSSQPDLYERADTLVAVREAYLRLAVSGGVKHRTVLVDGRASASEVTEKIAAILEQRFGLVQISPTFESDTP